MFIRTAGRFRWPLAAALVALVISVPALAIAERSSSGHAAAAKKKKKAKSLRGPRGPRGLQGFAGRAGKDGAAGPTGLGGAKGDKGDTGDQKTKVLNVAMLAGDAEVVVRNYPPFTITARCTDDGGGAFTARLVATTTTNDSFLNSEGGDQAPDFDVVSGEKLLAGATSALVTAPAGSHPFGSFVLAAAAGAGISGQVTIGTNVYKPDATAQNCLFTGTLTTT